MTVLALPVVAAVLLSLPAAGRLHLSSHRVASLRTELETELEKAGNATFKNERVRVQAPQLDPPSAGFDSKLIPSVARNQTPAKQTAEVHQSTGQDARQELKAVAAKLRRESQQSSAATESAAANGKHAAEAGTSLEDSVHAKGHNENHGFTEEGDAKHLHVHDVALNVVVPGCLVFLALFVMFNQLERQNLSWLPESLLTTMVALVFGFCIRGTLGHDYIFGDPEVASFANASFLNLVLLPVIIFESGWCLRVSDFRAQFFYILQFAIVGTLIATFSVFALVYVTGQWGLHRITGVRTCLCFASLISATDPVATLGTYAAMKVDPLLNIYVFGEALINDAVAIVLFRVFNSDTIMDAPWQGWTMKIISNITFNFLGSLFAGLLVGGFFVIVLRLAKMKHAPKLQVLYIACVCYLTYAFAEGFGMSGIISTLFCAILMSQYARPHMSDASYSMCTIFVKQLATLADISVFMLVGIAAANVGWSGLNFGMWCIPICMLGRAISTFPVGLGVDIIKKVHAKALSLDEPQAYLSPQHLFMMWHGGLRGGIALVLSMEIGPWADIIDGEGTKMLLQSATFLVIVFFLLVFGGSTAFFLKFMGIPTGVDAPEDLLSKVESTSRIITWQRWFHTHVGEPLFVGREASEEASK